MFTIVNGKLITASFGKCTAGVIFSLLLLMYCHLVVESNAWCNAYLLGFFSSLVGFAGSRAFSCNSCVRPCFWTTVIEIKLKECMSTIVWVCTVFFSGQLLFEGRIHQMMKHTALQM